MCIPVQTEATGLTRRTWFPVLDPRVVKHHGGGVVSLANGGCDLVPSHLIVDLQGCQQNVTLGVDLGTTDSGGVKNGLWAEAAVTDYTCAVHVRAPELASSRRLTDYSLGKRRAAFKSRLSVPKLNHFSQISSRLDWMAPVLMSWQLLLATHKQINHSDLWGKNRGTRWTQGYRNLVAWEEVRSFYYFTLSTLVQAPDANWFYTMVMVL